MAFEILPLKILGDVLEIVPRTFQDHRGHFVELYKSSDFRKAGIPDVFVQDNYSYSTKGVLRGLHYQNPPHAQGKLIQCMTGSILDVCVDVRPSSPTFGKWDSLQLSSSEIRLLYIPPGFAHGFYVISEEAVVVYKCTAEYSPECER